MLIKLKHKVGEFVKKSKEAWNNYFEIGEDDFVIFDRKYRKEDLEHYDYYGAIWTDKGLIYKAKMKGVLPNGEIDWALLWRD